MTQLTVLIGARIAALRKEQYRSGQSFADALTKAGWNTSRATLADIESGRRKLLSIEELIIIADVLDVTIPDLIAQAVAGQSTVEVEGRAWRPNGRRDRHRWEGIIGGRRVGLELVGDPNQPGHYELRVVEES